MRVAHLTLQARVVNTKGQQCFQQDLQTLRFLALRGIYRDCMVTSMEGYIPSAWGKHLAKKAVTCHRNNKMKMQYQESLNIGEWLIRSQIWMACVWQKSINPNLLCKDTHRVYFGFAAFQLMVTEVFHCKEIATNTGLQPQGEINPSESKWEKSN